MYIFRNRYTEGVYIFRNRYTEGVCIFRNTYTEGVCILRNRYTEGVCILRNRYTEGVCILRNRYIQKAKASHSQGQPSGRCMHHVSLLSCEAASFEVQRQTVAAVQTGAAYLFVFSAAVQRTYVQQCCHC